MKQLSSVLLKVGVCVACAFCLGLATTAQPATAADPIKIGVVISVSGPYGFIGTPQQEVLKAAVDAENRKGGINGRPLEILIEDDKSVPTNAVIAATKLIKDKKVCAIIAASSSDSSAAIIPTAEKEKVPYVITAPVATPEKKYVFLAGPGDKRGAAHLLEYAVKSMHAKRIALLNETALYGKTGADTVLAEVKKYPGVSIVIHEKMENTDTNIVPQLTKIKSANADLLILYATAPSAAVFAKNYKQLGLTTPVLGSNAITTPDFLNLAGGLAEEYKFLMLTQPFLVAEKMGPEEPFRKNLYDPFKKMMKEAYGESKMVNMFHASTYDAFNGLIAALRLTNSDDRQVLRDGLEKVNVPGFLGNFAPTADDHYGAHIDPMIPVVVKGGEYIPYTQQ